MTTLAMAENDENPAHAGPEPWWQTGHFPDLARATTEELRRALVIYAALVGGLGIVLGMALCFVISTWIG